VLEVLHHRTKGRLGFYPPPGRPKTSVCCFVTLLNDRGCLPYFAMKALEHRNATILMPLDMGKFKVVQPRLTLSDCCQLAIPQNAEVQKTAKIGVFATRGRQNKPIETKFGVPAYTRVCSGALNLASSVKGVSTRVSRNLKICQKLWFWPPDA